MLQSSPIEVHLVPCNSFDMLPRSAGAEDPQTIAALEQLYVLPHASILVFLTDSLDTRASAGYASYALVGAVYFIYYPYRSTH